jgi:IPT/TIG domain
MISWRFARVFVALVTLCSAGVVLAGEAAGASTSSVGTPAAPHLVGHVTGTNESDASTDWSGEVGGNATFAGVGAGWNVPSVVASPTAEATSQWIGVGGVLGESDTLQAGTEETTSGGTTTYSVWTSQDGGARVPLPATDVVQPGDSMSAEIFQATAGTGPWTMTVQDQTAPDAWSWDAIVSDSTAAQSAEWIEDAPISSEPLANFGSVNFSPEYDLAPGSSAPMYTDVDMTDPSGTIIAYPEPFNGTGLITINEGDPQPVVTSVSPASGSTAGGDSVTIDGEYLFDPNPLVTFGGVDVTAGTINADGSLTVTTPSEGAGTVQVVITTTGGASAPSAGSEYTYVAPTSRPSVTSLSPTSGSTAGGTSVTIKGDNLNGATGVSFGGVTAQFTVNSNTSVTATTPPGSAGAVQVIVTTPGGSSTSGAGSTYTYVAPTTTPPPPPVTSPTTSSHGYWLVGSDGGIFSFGSAQFYGSTGSLRLQRPVVGIVPTTDRGGYWLDASDGGVFAFGDSGFYGSIPGVGLHPAGSGQPNSLNAPIVGMVPSTDGGGYFMVASDGGVFAFGDARFAGSCPGIGGCSGSAVAVMPDSTGNGYWVVTTTGAIYAFGDAPYYGAPGPKSSPVTSAVATPSGKGYWILYADGTVSNYGDAGAFGSPSGQFGGANPANAIFTTSDGQGYWIASGNGTVQNFGDAPNDGSMAGMHLNGSIIAATGW